MRICRKFELVQRCNHISILQNVPEFNHFLEKIAKMESLTLHNDAMLRHDIILCAHAIVPTLLRLKMVMIIGCVEFHFSEFLHHDKLI